MDAKWFTARIRVLAHTAREFAEDNQKCKRKAVGCYILEDMDNNCAWQTTAINGPSHPDNECTNEVGNCGCGHAEPKAILSYLQHGKKGPAVLYTTYSPCTPCVNLIIEAGVIDVVIYEIFAPHWATADKILRRVLPVWELKDITKELIEEWISTIS